MNKYLDEAEQALYMAGEEVAAGKPLSAIDCVMKAVGLLIEERRATASPRPHVEEEKASFPALPIDAEDERIVDGLMARHERKASEILRRGAERIARLEQEEKAAGEAEPNPCNWCDRCRRCCDANESACRECGEKTRALADEPTDAELDRIVASVGAVRAKAPGVEVQAQRALYRAGQASAAREAERLREKLHDRDRFIEELRRELSAIPPEMRPEKA